ncbi:MAG TPA: SRPBCC family protein [Longimicrobium sp.]|nr:SRPBCC family protein [Longimicrobium sp.]
MGIEFQVTEILPGTPEHVFHALTDLEAAAHWMPGFVAIERVGEVRQGLGMRWRETRRMRGSEATEEFEVTHYHPPSHLSMRIDGSKGTSGRGTYAFDYRLAPRVGGTEVRMTGRIDGLLPAMLRWMEPLLGGMFKRMCGKELRALARHLGRARHAPTPAAAAET